jgi:DNA-binding CsgD family transcriptional regulator
MEQSHPIGLSGPETGYFQASDSAFLSLVIKGYSDETFPHEESFFKTFDFLPFGAAISESISSDFFYANHALLNRLGVSLTDFQDQGVRLLKRGNGKAVKQLWIKLKLLLTDHKKVSHEPFGCILRYTLKVGNASLNVMHNVNEFMPASGQRLFMHIILPEPEQNFCESEIYIPCRNFRWKRSMKEEESYLNSLPGLSQREMEIFEEIVRGRTSQQISNKFQLSINTVKIHRKNILKKFDVKNTVEAIAKMRKKEELSQKLSAKLK